MSILKKDRELIRELLLFNKPSDTQIISWLAENMHPNRLIFVDGVVKGDGVSDIFVDVGMPMMGIWRVIEYAYEKGIF